MQSSLRSLDAHLRVLRAEAKTGLSLQDVRRTLIKEKLRQPAPSASVTVPAGAGCSVAEMPSAWLEGDLHLDLAVNDKGAGVASSAGARVEGATPFTTSACSASSPRLSSAALRTYEALRAAAEEVDYDVSYEEALRHVEERDSETGLATAWRTRRCPSVPLLFSLTALTDSVEERDEGGRCLTLKGGATAAGDLHPAVSNELYTAPPSRPSVIDRGVTCRLAAALSDSRPASQASVVSATAPSSITATNRGKGQVPRAQVGSGGALSSLSAVGTAVACSSVARYTMTLRRLVQEQRRHMGDVGGGTPPSGWTSAAWLGREDTDRCDGTGALEWRTRLTAAVTLAVCPSCHAWYERTPQPSRRRWSSEEALQSAAGDAEDSRCCCPRCGHGVDADTPVAAAARAGPRWAWAPPATKADYGETAQGCDETSATAMNSAIVPCPQNASSPAPAASHRWCNAAIVEARSTDSVGFEGGREESFAALVARIRASRRRAQEVQEGSEMTTTRAAETQMCQPPLRNTSIVHPPPFTQLTPATACAGVGISHACADAGMPGTGAFSPAGTSSGPPPSSEPAAPTQENRLAQSLRAALNRLYLYDLWASAMGEPG
ncbi:hypothetical protein LSCM1_06844 [Leishmania martiniquensis]|uniref:Uncharacterized protein n=1 Tax=Leishmania martiniquensis TaxID=1580590 RepID=A0A836H120_9TRYP|nr:hypothetical protein LSCM1_06844 [Leishmania martiniquensis]